MGTRGDVVIFTFNCLHYLNYEAITHSSSNCHYFLHGASSGHTISSYGWCDRFTQAVNFNSFSRERLMFRPSYTTDCVIVFHVSPLSYSLRCSWGIFVSMCMYDISIPLHNCMVEFEYGICPSLQTSMIEYK